VSRLALSLAAVVAVLGVAVPTVAGGSPKPSVRIVTTSPLVVGGTHFRAHERVRVTASPGGTRRVTARADGSFRAAFRGAVDRCVGLSVTAVGARGDRAELALKFPQRACAPAD